jgi:hypothetical protein
MTPRSLPPVARNQQDASNVAPPSPVEAGKHKPTHPAVTTTAQPVSRASLWPGDGQPLLWCRFVRQIRTYPGRILFSPVGMMVRSGLRFGTGLTSLISFLFPDLPNGFACCVAVDGRQGQRISFCSRTKFRLDPAQPCTRPVGHAVRCPTAKMGAEQCLARPF